MSRAVPLVVAALLVMAGCDGGPSAQPAPPASGATSSAPRSSTAPTSATVTPKPNRAASSTTTSEAGVTAAVTASPRPATSAAPANATPYTVVAHQPAGLDQLPSRAVVAPIRVRVEGFDIDALVVPVSADPADGELAVPPTPDLVAWYQHGPAPGEGGSAVLAAHVAWDGARGPFFTLSSVTPGASVVVTVADGHDVVYRVTRVEQMPKADLPRDEMFARDGPARLTLVTCGGTFDSRQRHYDDNVVVFAELA